LVVHVVQQLENSVSHLGNPLGCEGTLQCTANLKEEKRKKLRKKKKVKKKNKKGSTSTMGLRR
jgi:hypothetical protein